MKPEQQFHPPPPASKAPHARTEQTGANQHLQPAGMSPVSVVVEKKRRIQVFQTSPGTFAAECYPNMLSREENGCVLEAVAIMLWGKVLI